MAVKSIDIIKSYLTEGKYPTASELVNIIDTLVSIGQNSGGGDTSGLATVATTGSYNDLLNLPTLFSGSYNDLSGKPTIPTVPTISTNITSDAANDTKTASPKAVKDFVEGKGYLTQHQDISSKADATDLEALEDRVETLEQSSGGGTTQYSYLKLIPDLDAYTEASVGEIVKYNGQTNNKYTRGWDYECITAGSASTVVVPQFAQILDVADTNENTEFATFMGSAKKPFIHTGETVIFDKYQRAGEGTQNAGYLFPHGQTPQAGDYVYYHITSLLPCLVISNDGTSLVVQHPSYSSTRTLQSQPTVQNSDTFYMFTNPDNIQLLIGVQNQNTTPKGQAYPVLDYTNNVIYDDTNASGKNPVTRITFYSQSDTITYGSTPEWQPIIYPSAPVSSSN